MEYLEVSGVAYEKSVNPLKFLSAIRKTAQNGLVREDVPVLRKRIEQEILGLESQMGRRRRKRSSNAFEERHAYNALCAIKDSSFEQFIKPVIDHRHTVRLRGMLKVCETLHKKIERTARNQLSASIKQDMAGYQSAVYDYLCDQNDRIRSILAGKDLQQLNFPKRTFRAVKWLIFLEKDENFKSHVEAIISALSMFPDILVQNRKLANFTSEPFAIRYFPGSSLFRSDRKEGIFTVTINEGFINAPQQVLYSILRMASSTGTKVHKHNMASYSNSADYLRISRELLQQKSTEGSGAGLFHNLSTLCEKVEEDYSVPSIERPQLSWMDRASFRTFGVYQPSSDSIRISPVLDHPEVPEFIVEYVLFHELVHSWVGVRVRNGRSQIHSKRFKGLEHQFARRDEAAAFLNELNRSYCRGSE